MFFYYGSLNVCHANSNPFNLLKFIQNSESKKEESNKKKQEPPPSQSIKEKTTAPVAKFLPPAVAKIKQNDHNAHIFFPWQEAVQTAIYRKNA